MEKVWQTSREESSLEFTVVKQFDFDFSKGKFIVFCAENNVNSDWSILWLSMSLNGSIMVYRAKVN